MREEGDGEAMATIDRDAGMKEEEAVVSDLKAIYIYIYIALTRMGCWSHSDRANRSGFYSYH